MALSRAALSPAQVRAIAAAWDRRLDGEPAPLSGGEEAACYRLGQTVVRVGPPWRTCREARWCYSLAARASGAVAQALAPIPARSGAVVARVEGRPVSLWPLVQGAWLDRDSASQCAQAAALLGRLHRALARLRVPVRPAVSVLDWRWAGAAAYEPAAFADPALDRWLAEFHRGRAVQPLHGDFYRGNLLVAGGEIVALIDWDDAFMGPPEVEVASAARELGSRWGADLGPARRIVDAYREAGGPAMIADDEALAQLIRHRLRREAAYQELEQARGRAMEAGDRTYRDQLLDLFRRLRP